MPERIVECGERWGAVTVMAYFEAQSVPTERRPVLLRYRHFREKRMILKVATFSYLVT